jgi:hypothetical protein
MAVETARLSGRFKRPLETCTSYSKWILTCRRAFTHPLRLPCHQMKFHSEMHEVIKSINGVRGGLRDLVIAINRPGESDWWTHDGHWHELGERLDASLKDADRINTELRQALYLKGIRALLARTKAPATKPDQIPVKVQKALDYIKERGHVKGLLVAKHIQVSYARFRSNYVPKLRALGVVNEGEGYCLPDPEPPPSLPPPSFGDNSLDIPF